MGKVPIFMINELITFTYARYDIYLIVSTFYFIPTYSAYCLVCH